MILFVTMLILTYFISERFIDYVLTVDPIVLKRVCNMILVVIIMFLYNKK